MSLSPFLKASTAKVFKDEVKIFSSGKHLQDNAYPTTKESTELCNVIVP